MESVDTALDRVWPAQLRTDRLHLRPVTRQDSHLVEELLTDDRVRAYLGGPVTEDRVATRQAAYPTTAGAFTVVRVADQRPVGLVTIGADHRCEGRAELSYQLLPAAWGKGLGWEAVAAAVTWWTDAVPGAGPLVAVTQKANTGSCRLLEAIGMTVVDELDEHGARQCVYTPAGDQADSDLRWFRLLAERRDSVERRRGAQARATPAGQHLPDDFATLTAEDLARLCSARHGAYGRICARMAGHTPDLHLGRAQDGAWIAWLTTADA
ncbi:GNAT family N-acetyltransferase [Streptomyces sp. NRRL S-241]|uniref:GNAT family N-acetyltransferase n=1 Tax=Streptomyces sp. NRRL S-241 TaxID=1463896 RepID=UPI000690AD16|nr:GNAT family N-acetyltransferase [Streptomyces sp. NRRL S-241]